MDDQIVIHMKWLTYIKWVYLVLVANISLPFWYASGHIQQHNMFRSTIFNSKLKYHILAFHLELFLDIAWSSSRFVAYT